MIVIVSNIMVCLGVLIKNQVSLSRPDKDKLIGLATCEGMEDSDFKQRMEELHKMLELLSAKVHELEARITYNMCKL